MTQSRHSAPEAVHLLIGAATSAVSHAVVPLRNCWDFFLRAIVGAGLTFFLSTLFGWSLAT